jgi:hypothetical protein
MTTIQPELVAGDDDFVAEILARRKRRLPILTAILVLAVAAGGAFIAGAEVQKHYGKSTSAGTGGAPTLSALASRFRAGGGAGTGGGTGRAGFFGGAGGAGGGTTGTVTLIKGSTLYVTNSSGTTVLVHTSPASRVTKSVTGSVQTIHPGDTVTVTGAQAANGSYTAAAISIGGGTGG